MKNTLILLFAITTAPSFAQNFQTSKVLENQLNTEQSFIYALPQTNIEITIETTKTTIKKGRYAAFAEKYLRLTDVPLKDSLVWGISTIKIKPQNEADPLQYYAVTFKMLPGSLQHLFSMSQGMAILDFSNTWKTRTCNNLSPEGPGLVPFDPGITEEIHHEKVDTFYKTIMTDTTFVKIPVFKKQILAKTEEDIIRETANELIKTRRRKIKMLRGEYDFHPDGAALKIMVDELEKYEEALLKLFIGEKLTEKKQYTFSFIPQTDVLLKELCYFSPERGIQQQKKDNYSLVSVQTAQERTIIAQKTIPVKAKNSLYVRNPAMASVIVKLSDIPIATSRIPVYQFGAIQAMPLH